MDNLGSPDIWRNLVTQKAETNNNRKKAEEEETVWREKEKT